MAEDVKLHRFVALKFLPDEVAKDAQALARFQAGEALLAVGLQHFLPAGHYHLGVALARLGHLQCARLAFETALSMLPGLVPAHRLLAAIHSRPGGDPVKASEHRKMILQLRRSAVA